MSYATTVLADNPLMYLRTGEASGTVAGDTSGNGRTGTYAGSGVTYGVTGALVSDTDTAVTFNGTTGKIDIANPTTATSNVTLEYWAKLPSSSIKGGGIKLGPDANGYGIGFGSGAWDTNGTVPIYLRGGVGWTVSPGGAVSTGVWHHIVLVLDGSGQPNFYVDGVALGAVAVAAPSAPTATGYVGSDATGTRFLNASMDEIAVYGTALSGARIAAHYNAGAFPSFLMTTLGHNLLRDGQSGANNALIKYIAFGTGSAAPTIGDTKLVAETFRKAITSFSNGASTGELLSNMYLSPADAVSYSISEVGIFGGSSASSALNSGVLIARGLFTHTHVATESIIFTYDSIV
jgi:hypothetical protein